MKRKVTKTVEHIREEIKFIKRYVGLHNKVKSPNAILSFLKALQKSVIQKLIRKTSPLAKQIERIQDHLIQFYNSMRNEKTFKVNEKELPKLILIAGGEEVYPSVTVIKRFIGMQGKEVEGEKIEAFIKFMKNLVKKKKLTKDDPYADKVNFIYRTLLKSSGKKISINETELNGLEEIATACSCKETLGQIYKRKTRPAKGKMLRRCMKKTFTDSYNRGACSHNYGLSGVITAEQMANRKLDLLNFFSFGCRYSECQPKTSQ